MPTSTTNYGLQKPLVNNPTDSDLWGGYLNTDIDSIDSLMLTAMNWTVSSKTSTITVTIPTAGSTTTGSAKLLYLCSATGGAFSANLPAASTATNMTVAFKKTDSSANVITIQANAAELIDGANTLLLSSQYAWAILVCDGTGWDIISENFSAAGLAPLASPTFTGTPAAPTAASNTRTTQLATTAFANPAATLSSTGTVTLPSGLIMKWGTVTAGAGSSAAVTFAAAFPSAVYNVTLTPQFGSGSTLASVAVTSATASGFTYWNTNSGATITSYWFAVGA